MLNDSLLQRCRALSVPLVADALVELGLKLEFAPGFHPVGDGSVLVGTAITLRIARVEQERRNGYAHFAAALEAARSTFAPLLVIQSPDVAEATWDAVHAEAARRHGVVGVVLDGATRDVDELRAMKFPVFATRLSPWPVSSRVDSLSLNAPIHIGGEEVDAGDIVFADRNGIAMVPPESLAQVLQRAEQLKGRRETIQQSLRNGTPYEEALRPPEL